MEIKELENQLEMLKSNVVELENKIVEMKKNENKINKIPDVKDIPQTYDFDDYTKVARYLHRGLFVNDEGKLIHTDIDKTVKSNMIFPTKEFAEMFKEKAQLIADYLLFKWYYDRDYEPIWDGCTNNWCVVYDRREERYAVCVYNNLRHNTVYFSTREIAEKCAEWLNYKYLGIYNLKI